MEAKASPKFGALEVGASSVAKVTDPFSKKVDVIQGKPVTTCCSVEGHEPFFSKQLNEAAVGPRDRPVAADLKEASGHVQDGRKPAPFLLELFCGTAGVCAQFRLQGGRALGVDHHLKRHKLKAAAVKLDLTQPWVQQLIIREIKLGRISGVHLGPPCGTASKARCIPVKRKLVRKGAPNPKPYRSPRYPLIIRVSMAERREPSKSPGRKLPLQVFCRDSVTVRLTQHTFHCGESSKQPYVEDTFL